MNNEKNRRDTFENYKCTANPNFEPESYAKVGFYATGNGEEIKCHFCHRTLVRLLSDDPDAVTLHLRTNSSCPLIRRKTTDNVELPPFELDKILPPQFDDTQGIGVLTKYPEFIFFDKRLRSYRNWPKPSPSPDDLSRAGFFALGESDKVACFSCGLGLMQFDETDDPFEEHARWGSACDFLIQTKGPEYIQEIKQKFND